MWWENGALKVVIIVVIFIIVFAIIISLYILSGINVQLRIRTVWVLEYATELVQTEFSAV